MTDSRDSIGGEVRAPGTLESHYAPLARVLLVEPAHTSTDDLVAVGDRAPSGVRPAPGGVGHDPFELSTLESPEPARILQDEAAPGDAVGLVAPPSISTPEGWTRLVSPDTPDEYARCLYAALRRADTLRLATVVAVLPDPREGPLALAVRDRLSRAAHES